MQILTETPTEDGHYVVLWAATNKLWCNQIRIRNGTMERRINMTEPPNNQDNWTTLVPGYMLDNSTFLKL